MFHIKCLRSDEQKATPRVMKSATREYNLTNQRDGERGQQ